MLGLIRKDLLMIRSNFKLLAILFFVYGVMTFQGEMDLSFLLPFMSVMIMISTFSYDNYNQWDAYAITLPDGRKNSVRAKYLATILLIIVTAIIITVLAIIIAYMRTKVINFENIFSTLLGAIFATSLLLSCMYPAIYKFGVEKARIGLLVVVFGVAIIGGIIVKIFDFESLFQVLDTLNNYWLVIIPIVTILMIYLSCKISEGIYKKREY